MAERSAYPCVASKFGMPAGHGTATIAGCGMISHRFEALAELGGIAMRTFTAIAIQLLLVGGLAARAQQVDWDTVEIKAHHVAGSVHMLEGRGGNIGVSAGADGVVLIDDQFAPLTDKIVAAVAAISEQPIRFLINTHIHPDHVGGNENLGKRGTLIFAHDSVRARMAAGIMNLRTNERMAPMPPAALPVVTFSTSITFHLNGEQVHAFRIAPAHTDGDTFIHFRGSDVLHLGDVFRTTSYPVMDTGNGGRYAGIIAGVETAIAIAGPKTRIIPGHGEITDKAMLIEVRDMLVQIRDAIQTLIAQGKTLEEVVAAKPTAQFDARWGGGFFTPAHFVATVHGELAGN